MITRTPVKRIAIKLRKSIHKDFCDCWGIKVFTSDGLPYLVVGDGISYDKFKEFLDAVDTCTGVYFSEPLQTCIDKVNLCLDMQLPVTIRTTGVLSDELIVRMSEVPHSSIIVSMGFLDDFLRESIEPGSSPAFPLRQMMTIAKSLKIFVLLDIDYRPHIMNKLDIFETIEMVRNCCGHILVRFSGVTDYNLYSNKFEWQILAPDSMRLFKYYYVADIARRSWAVGPRAKKDFIYALLEFLKYKNLTLEILDDEMDTTSNRINHEPTRLNDYPLGIKPFSYKKKDGLFTDMGDPQVCVCPKCGKDILM